MTAGSVGVHSVIGMSELPVQTNYIAIRAEFRAREVTVLYSTGQDRILYMCGSECQMFGGTWVDSVLVKGKDSFNAYGET